MLARFLIIASLLLPISTGAAQCQTSLASQVDSLTPGDTLFLSGTYAEDLDLRKLTGNVTIIGPASVQVVRTDGPIEVTLRDLTMTALRARRGTWVQFAGAIVVQGFVAGSDPFGIQGNGYVRFGWVDNGSLQINGPAVGANVWGLHLVNHSSFMDFSHAVSITVRKSAICHQLGFQAAYTIQGTGSSTVLEDCTTKGIQATDNSTWSTNKPLTYRRVPSQRDINSMSYYEAVGGVTVQ